MNHKKLDWLNQEVGWSVRRHCDRKQAFSSQTRMQMPRRRDDRWSMDLVADTYIP